MSTINIEVPDIGDFADVPVIEVLVKPGDRVALDAPLVTLESDKATMDIPAPAAGVIGQITVKVGDRVSQGATIGTMDAGAPEATTASVTAPTAAVAALPVAPPPVPIPGKVQWPEGFIELSRQDYAASDIRKMKRAEGGGQAGAGGHRRPRERRRRAAGRARRIPRPAARM